MAVKTVVELDLVGYSDISHTLEENLGAEVVARFNEQIQSFVDKGLAATNTTREKVVKATTGDGAILAFDDPADAHRFAFAAHTATKAHNAGLNLPSAQRWFRIGVATGDLFERSSNGKQEIAGMVIVRAVRLESAAQPGELVIDAATFNLLAPEYQSAYGAEESVPGKKHDKPFAVRRCKVVEYEATQDGKPTANSIFQMFDSLRPRDQSQIHRVMILLEMPRDRRPPDTVNLYRQQNEIVDWATEQGENALRKLASILKGSIGDAQNPRK